MREVQRPSQADDASLDEDATPNSLTAVYGGTARAQLLDESLAPYRQTLEIEHKPVLQRLTAEDDDASAYKYGEDLMLVTGEEEDTTRSIPIPDGVWVNYWTGRQVLGGQTVSLDVEGVPYPMWVRGGTVLPLAAGTIGPLGAAPHLSSDATCQNTCQYEILSAFGDAEGDAAVESNDPSARTLVRKQESLQIHGQPVHAVVRWRFDRITNVRLNGVAVRTTPSTEGDLIEFDHASDSEITWTHISDFSRDSAHLRRRSRTARPSTIATRALIAKR